MGFLGMFNRNGPSAADQTIFTALNGPTIDRDDVAILKSLLGSISVTTRKNPDEEFQSLTVPRTPLRNLITADTTFRRALRTMPFKLQDLNGRTMKLSEPMTAEVYVKEAKYNGLSHTQGRELIPFDVRMRWLEDAVGEWGHVRIPAIILLTIVGFVGYGGWKLATYAGRVIEEYAAVTAAASTSEKGLEAAIRARSGRMQEKAAKGAEENAEVVNVQTPAKK